MKTIRSLTTNLGLSLVLFVLAAIGAKAETLDSTQFVGTFTLPFAAQWGKTTLPAGSYTLNYGTIYGAGDFVEVIGTGKGSPHFAIQAGGTNQTPAKKNAIVCVRYGNTLIIRALEMPAIGASVDFALPPGTKLTAHHGGGTNTQLAEAHMLIQRVPIKLNAK